MNQLQVDPKTGFIQSPSVTNYTFTVDKKTRFLEIAHAERAAGRYPDIGLIAEQVGVNMRTVDRHLVQDEKFKSEWDEIVLRTEATCMADMYEMRKKQPLFMFGLLRRLLPSRWNPDSKISLSVDFQHTDGLLNKASALDAEVSPALAPKSEALPSTEHILTQDMRGKSVDE